MVFWCYDGCEDEIIIKIKEGGQKPLKERQTRHDRQQYVSK